MNDVILEPEINLTDEGSEENEMKRSWILHKTLMYALQQNTRWFLIVGKTLKDIRDTKAYKHIGNGGSDTFDQYLNFE